jgi:NAD(P)-dependent dehydrogenase (short-subunit alcohol dehydrogenase family)
VLPVPIDLGDLASVFRAVKQIQTLTNSIDILFANAGISRAFKPLSPDGVEPVFAVNYLGHYAFITRLLPILEQSTSRPESDVRVVITSSSLVWYARKLNTRYFQSPFDESKDKLLDMYTRSKLAVLLFGLKLSKIVNDTGGRRILVNVGDPGIIFGTGVHKQMEGVYNIWQKFIAFLLDWFVGISREEGSLTLLCLGTSPSIRENIITGSFYRPFGNVIPRNKYPKNATEEAGRKLWDWSERFVSSREAELRSHSDDNKD